MDSFNKGGKEELGKTNNKQQLTIEINLIIKKIFTISKKKYNICIIYTGKENIMKIKNNKGFTIVELLIVSGILALLSAIALPKFFYMIERSKEGATKANISAIISAIRIYYSDNSIKWPDDITDPSFKKYLEEIPAVKVTHFFGGYRLSGTCNTVEIVKDNPGKGKGHAYGIDKIKENTDGWRYDHETGDVWVNNAQTDTRGINYTLYGHE